MQQVKISQLPYVTSSGLTNDDIFPIVNYDYVSGTTKHTKITDLKDYVLSGVTFGGTFTGGTVTGSTNFTNGLTSNTFTTSAITLNGITITGFTSNTFTGNTSATCITDLYVENLYGCSPITIHDSLQMLTSSAKTIYSVSLGVKNITYGEISFSLGKDSISGWKGFNILSVSNGVIRLHTSYGDVTSQFNGVPNDVLIEKPDTSIYTYSISAVTYDTILSSTTIYLNNITVNNGSYIAHITNTYSDYADNYLGAGSYTNGGDTKSFGNYSRAEGILTKSYGNGSHSEGYNTKSIGNYSHTEGYGTVALGNYQHVSGKFNYYSGLTTEGAFIIGNGTDDTNRSNLLVAGDNQVTIYGDLSATTMSATSITIGGLGVVKKYTTTLTFTASVTQTITHNLNTKFVHCSVWDSSDQLVTAQVVRTSGNQTNAVDITISTSGTYDILITG